MVEYGVSTFTMTGQTECGDLHVVQTQESSALVAAVDGAGHGKAAADAAGIAAATLESHAQDGLPALVKRCHTALRRTRGAVMSLAEFDGGQNRMTWLGVGNVEGVFLHGQYGPQVNRETLFLRNGLVGYSLPRLLPGSFPVSPGDVLIFATDGIRVPFDQGVSLFDPPQRIAEQIRAQHCKTNDDGLVLVVRYVGCKC